MKIIYTMRDIVLINLVKRFLNTYEILALNQAKLNQQFSELLPQIAGSNKISSEDKLNLTNKSISIFKNLDNALQIKINDSKTTLTDYARFLEHQLTTRTLMIKDNYEWEYIDSINELEFSATQLIQAQNNLLLDANSSTLMNSYNNDKNRNKIISSIEMLNKKSMQFNSCAQNFINNTQTCQDKRGRIPDYPYTLTHDQVEDILRWAKEETPNKNDEQDS